MSDLEGPEPGILTQAFRGFIWNNPAVRAPESGFEPFASRFFHLRTAPSSVSHVLDFRPPF